MPTIQRILSSFIFLTYSSVADAQNTVLSFLCPSSLCATDILTVSSATWLLGSTLYLLASAECTSGQLLSRNLSQTATFAYHPEPRCPVTSRPDEFSPLISRPSAESSPPPVRNTWCPNEQRTQNRFIRLDGRTDMESNAGREWSIHQRNLTHMLVKRIYTPPTTMNEVISLLLA
ncbi:unnamed protein product [Calicophoron daubneyi]|uniref:Uncharacterized protein n=1 Tax=Calicophoron daubneyi TaxID=300641 RepID=A0AAV2TI40_CALDB